MNSYKDRIYHIKGRSLYHIGQRIGQRIGARLQEKIEHYIQRRPLPGEIIETEKLQAGALPWMRSLPWPWE